MAIENIIYKRSTDLINKYVDFIKSVDTQNIRDNITVEKLVNLKSILSNINNVMTLLATLSIAKKLIKILLLEDDDSRKLLLNIENKKANANGFDIQIDAPVKILVEVKCNTLIRDKKFGAAQINAILDDARKLRLESPRHQKISKNFQNTTDYVKIIAIVNFSSKIDECLISQITKDIKCKESTNQARKERMKVKTFLKPLKSLSEIIKLKETEKQENVYITVLSKNDLKEELEQIKYQEL